MLAIFVVVLTMVLAVFHPEVPCSFACFLGFVLVVVFVSRCVVANALMFVVVVVMVVVVVVMVVVLALFVVVVVAMVVSMVVSAGHGGHGHGEGLHVFGLKFKDILAFFEMIDGHHGSGRTVTASG